MEIKRQKYNRWKLRKEAFKKLKEMGQHETYIDHKRLDLENNNIEEIPSWIGKLKELKVLLLDNNNIQQIPTEILKECNSLERLWLNGNPIPQKELERAEKELNVEIHYY